ncbi:MAG TPA: tripartite tricarboxylate transporter substrate binding protein, partial [Burkholderiales bacterium]|nr:tripartite tricarboxylate transporter substrate binding protein [Burkholderiales bacterium]
MIRLIASIAGLVLAIAAAIPVSAADAYPSKPIRLVVPAPPGGTIDPISRLLAEAMTRRYGQNV